MLTIQPEEQPLIERLAGQEIVMDSLCFFTREWRPEQGFVIPLLSEQTTFDLWLPAQYLNAWCEEQLGTTEMDRIDPLLLSGIIEWGLSPFLSAIKLRVIYHRPLPCSIISQLSLTVAWKTENYDFRGVLFKWPEKYLAELTEKINPPVREAGKVPPLRLALYAGWGELTLSELYQVRPGFGIRIQLIGDIRAGEFAALLPGGVALKIQLNETNTMKINEIVQDIETLLVKDRNMAECDENTRVNIDELSQTLLVEAGQVTLTLEELRSLGEGDVVKISSQFQPFVTLRLNGRAIGQGELIACQGSFLLRITRWYLNQL